MSNRNLYDGLRVVVFSVLSLFVLAAVLLPADNVLAIICEDGTQEAKCGSQCPNPKAAQYSFSYYMRIGEIRWDATLNTFWSDPAGRCGTWPTPPNQEAYCSKDYMDSLRITITGNGPCPYVDSGHYCINGSGGNNNCTPGGPSAPPPGGGGGPEPVPGTTFGPQPSLQGPTISSDTEETRYCAYKGEDSLPICICGSQKDEKLNSDGTIDSAGSCTQTKYCLDQLAKTGTNPCIRVTHGQCTGKPPLGQEGVIVNQKIEDIGDLIATIFSWSLGILGLSLFSMILYAGFEWLTAAGDPGRIGRAKGRIYNAILGAILLLSSYIILELINPNLVRNSINFDILGTPAAPRPTPTMEHTSCWI